MQPKHRILTLITHNQMGGAQEALARLSQALEARGHDVELWYLYNREPAIAPKVRSQVLFGSSAGPLDYARIVFRLHAGLRRLKPDAVISFLPLANIVGQTLAWITGVPTRIASQRNPTETYGGIMRALDWYVGTCGSYTHNVGNSQDVLASTNAYPLPYRFRRLLVYNGIAAAPPALTRAAARAAFGLKAEEIALVTVGRMTHQKNQAFLIQLLNKLDNFKLLICGDGEEKTSLIAESQNMGVENRIHFLGALRRNEVQSLLCAADIFTLPSIFEGQSNSLLEAMIAGLPIVVSDLDTHKETLGYGNDASGIILPLTEPDIWISTFNDLGSQPDRRRYYGRLASERAKLFSLEKMCVAFESMMSTTGSSELVESNI